MSAQGPPAACSKLPPSGTGDRRFYRFGGLFAGGDVDGVTSPTTVSGYCACPGQVVQVEAGGTFSAGANLQTDSSGRAVASAGGVIVARALDGSAGAGAIVSVVFVSGR